MTSKITTLLVVPHTHWDREWYQTFQQFRMRLVKCINHLLLILDTDPNFTNFMLDGQTVLLDDYLEIHPEEVEHLLNYVRSGRLLIGPWYIQPDEFLVSGEAIIRNLLLGLGQSSPYGGAMAVGYVPDCFGHIAQLPQIFQGFDIDNVVFWRGIDPAVEQSEFWWNAPDGSSVLAVYLDPTSGYSNARELPLNPEALLKRVEDITAVQSSRASTSMLLLMNGSDHLEPQDGLPAVLTVANTQLAAQEQSLILGSLPQYVQAILDDEPELPSFSGEFRFSKFAHLLPGVLSTRMWIKQRNAACEELLTGWVEPLSAWAWTLDGSRYPEGLIAMAWRLLLQNQPHDSVCGTSIDQVHREMVVRYDQCEQIAKQLIEDALQKLAQHVDIQSILPTLTSVQDDLFLPLVVFNPTQARSVALAETSLRAYIPGAQLHLLDEHGRDVPHVAQVVSETVILDETMDSAQMKDFLPTLETGKIAEHFMISLSFDENTPDEQGNKFLWAAVVPDEPNEQFYTQAAMERIRAALEASKDSRWRVRAVEIPHVALRFVAHDLPAYGGCVYLLSSRPGDGTEAVTDIVATDTAIENAWLRVEVDPADGSLTVTEKASETVYTGLHRFQDDGDVGDLYNWTPPATDMLISGLAAAPVIELLNNEAFQATLRITSVVRLPGRSSENGQTRHSEMVECTIVTDVTLISGGRTVEMHTTITNTASDHRLRVLFPTPLVTDHADADGTFMVNRRPVRRDVPENGWKDWIEEPVDTHPQKRFVSVSDEQRGLALLNRGLPEYEVFPAEGEQGVTLALTLLRCVGWLSRSDLANRHGPAGPVIATPEAQMLGTWSFDYALYPYSGSWEANAALVQQEAIAFNIGVWTTPTGLHTGRLDPNWSFMHLEPSDLVLSAVKRAEDGRGLIVRWYNPLDVEVTADLTTELDFVQADGVALSEETRPSIPGEADGPTHHWRIATPAGAIQTIRLNMI